MNRSRIRAVIFVYSAYLLIVTFYPFELSPGFTPSLAHFTAGFLGLVLDGWNWLGLKDFILNILLFLPCGALLYALWQNAHRPRIAALVFTTLGGASASFLIEYGQAFASRNSSAFDVIANTLGTALGALAYAGCKRRGHDPLLRSTEYLSSKVALCGVMLLAALPTAFSAQQLISPFWRWDSRPSLQIGNETTMGRPWFGKLYLVALYRRALSPEEIKNNFNAGVGAGSVMKRAQDDLVALYKFTERAGNIVHDSSNFAPSLDLEFSSGSRIRWLESSGGIELAKRGIIKSQAPATGLVQALKATRELSVEVWMTPRPTWKGRSAHIVSLSADSGPRNFILGQHGRDIHFRLRTPASANNGAPVGLQTSGGVLRAQTSHVVVTYARGVERLYIDGMQRPEIFDSATDGIVGFGTRKTVIAQLAYSFFYFFPASFVLYNVFSLCLKRIRWLVSAGAAVGLLGSAEVVQAFGLDRAVELPILGFGLLAGVLGGGVAIPFAGVAKWR